jgi:quercetin 2,3-dioxygenase
MIQQSKGKMFLADERGCSELDWFRSYNTFNFGAYKCEHKTPFGPLYVLNDDTLAGGKSLSIEVSDNTTVLLLPVVGAITISDSTGYADYIEAGQCRLYNAGKAAMLTISNPFNYDLVNFLQLWIRQPAASADIPQQKVSFDIDAGKNQLIELGAALEKHQLYIGKFSGRQEMEYHLQHPDNGVFVFVIEGAFEVQYRLLHARDGLALWDIDSIELEALSNDAIILLMELPLSS